MTDQVVEKKRVVEIEDGDVVVKAEEYEALQAAILEMHQILSDLMKTKLRKFERKEP